ncbi:8889_t:CDS:2 [Entrophospora sp. SA101]|nr:8889_t:CDS:2 [Entrophospora sp. SA101]
MPCLVNLIVYVTETREIPTINNFVMNTVGVTKSSTGEELAVHIVAFYPRDPDVKTNLQRIEPNQFVRVGGKFMIDDTDVDNSRMSLTSQLKQINGSEYFDSSRVSMDLKYTTRPPTITCSRLPNVYKKEAHLYCQKKKGKAPAASIRTKVKIPKLANLAVQNIGDGKCSTPMADNNEEDNE